MVDSWEYREDPGVFAAIVGAYAEGRLVEMPKPATKTKPGDPEWDEMVGRANEALQKLMPTDWEREPWPAAFLDIVLRAALVL
jgi:hypothetical protein